MGVDDDIRRHSRLRERHVFGGPQDGHDALLPVPRGELVPDDRVSLEAKRYAYAGKRGLVDALAAERADRLNAGLLGLLVLRGVNDVSFATVRGLWMQ